MRSYTYPAALVVTGLLLAGCSPSSGTRKVSASAATIGTGKAEFSPAAVERRTEAQAHFATAYLHDLDEEPELAAEEYLKAALADLTNEGLILDATSRLLRLKQNDKAVELLLKATAEKNAPGVFFAQLGLAYSLQGKKDLAIEANRTAIKKMPRSLAGYRHLAQIYLQNGQGEEGLKVLDQAAKQPDVDAAFLTELGEFYLAFSRTGAGDTGKVRALETFQRAAKLNPNHPVLQQKIADGFAFLGESDKAAEIYLKLLERFPQLPGLREKLAELYLRKKDRAHAAEQFEAILRANPANPQAYYFLGSIAYEEEKMKEAAEYFSKVVLLNPNFEPVYYDLAGAQINLNQPKDALDTLEKARAKFKSSFAGEFFTGMAYSRMKEYTNAINHLVAAEVIARATDTNRLTPVFYFQLGAAYERNKQYEEAEASFKRCLKLSPDFTEALNYLGYMWAERGVNLAEARELIEKAVKQEPKNAAYLDSLGWVLYKLDQPQEALTNLLKAVEYSKEPDSTIHDHLGDIYLTLKQPEKAREAWRKALSIGSDENKENIQKKLRSGVPPATAPPGSAPR